jgi:hypothetical protein
VERLNELLTTPAQQLGDLGRTNGLAGEEDDDLDSEMEDLELSRQMLAQELSRVDLSFFGGLSSSSTRASGTSGDVPTATPPSSGKKRGKDDEGDRGDAWTPLLPHEWNYGPSFTPTPGQQPSPRVTPPLSASSLKKKSPPKYSFGDTAKRKSGGRDMFGRFYSPLRTPPREKTESQKKPPPAADVGKTDDEDSKPTALKTPPKAASSIQQTVPSFSATEEAKTPDRPTTMPSTDSPFNPFGLGTPSSADSSVTLNPMDDSAAASQIGDQGDAGRASDLQVSLLGVGGIPDAGLEVQSSGGDGWNLFPSIASFAGRLAGTDASRPDNGTSTRSIAEEIDRSSRILQELDSILTPPRLRLDEEDSQRIPVVTPGDQTPLVGGSWRVDDAFDSPDIHSAGRSSSFIGTESTNVPTDERMETPDRQQLPSLFDTRQSAQPFHRRTEDEGTSTEPRAFGQDVFLTPPQHRAQSASLVEGTTQAESIEGDGSEAEPIRGAPQQGTRTSPRPWEAIGTRSASESKETTIATIPSSRSETKEGTSTPIQSTVPSITEAEKQPTTAGEKIVLTPSEGTSRAREEKETISGTTLFPIAQSRGSPIGMYRYPSDELVVEPPRSADHSDGSRHSRISDRPGRPPRAPVFGSFPSFTRVPSDEGQADIDRENEMKTGRPGDLPTSSANIEEGVTASSPLPNESVERDGFRGEETLSIRVVPPVLNEESDDEIIFDSGTPQYEGSDVCKVSSPPEPDQDYHELPPSKTTMGSETDESPAKTYSADAAKTGKRTGETKRLEGPKRTQTTRHNICVFCGIVVLIIGIATLMGTLIGRPSTETMLPSSAPVFVSPISTPIPTDFPSATLSMAPTFKKSEAPTPLGTVSFRTPYHIYIQNGLVSPVPESDYIPSLIEAMDRLTYDILKNIENGGAVQNLRSRELVVVLLPTDIIEVTNNSCPVVTGTDLCQRIVAYISLVDAEDKVKRFRATTELAIEIGRLQFHLNQVDPLCPAEIVDSSWQLPAPTPFSEPTFPPLLNPSVSPSVQLTMELSPFPSMNPVAAPGRPPPRPSPFPSSRPTIVMETASPTNIATGAPSLAPSTTPSALDLYNFLVENSFDGGVALAAPWSPQGKAYIWLLSDTEETFYSPERMLQRYAMATFYYATFGNTWLSNDLWLSKASECTWYNRVGERPACNRKQELVNLELDLNNLGGSLPAELGLLSNSLRRLTLRGGPTKFLAGSLPPELGYLTELKVFFVRGNNLSGIVPQEIGYWRLLEQLDLSKNRLAGTIPTEIGNLRELLFFEVSSNSLSGILPTQMGLMTKCARLYFEDNDFLSPIPTELGNLSLIKELKGGANTLLSLPSELGRLTDANTISFEGSNIPGRIPSELGRIQGLRKFQPLKFIRVFFFVSHSFF